MRKIISVLTLACVALASLPSLHAVKIKENALRNKRLFGIEMPNGLQSYYGRHDRINSVSLQEYQAGPYAVTEVVIDMASSPLQLRLYHTEIPSMDKARAAAPDVPGTTNRNVPDSVQRLAERGREKANSAELPVIKDYPVTTHAKTLEFRVSTKEELESFYRSFVGIYTQNNATGAQDEADDEASARGLAGTLFLIE